MSQTLPPLDMIPTVLPNGRPGHEIPWPPIYTQPGATAIDPRDLAFRQVRFPDGRVFAMRRAFRSPADRDEYQRDLLRQMTDAQGNSPRFVRVDLPPIRIPADCPSIPELLRSLEADAGPQAASGSDLGRATR